MPVIGDKCSHGCAELKTHLKVAAIDQKDFAISAGITPAMLNHLLYGRKRPSNKTAFALQTASSGSVRAESWTIPADDMTKIDLSGIDLGFDIDGRKKDAILEELQRRLYAVGHMTYVSLSVASAEALEHEISVDAAAARAIISQAKRLAKQARS